MSGRRVLSALPTAEDNQHGITCAAATHAVRAGWGRLDFLDVMMKRPSAAGRHIRQMAHLRGHDKTVKYLNRVWAQAEKTVELGTGIYSRADALADLERVLAGYSNLRWSGQAGSTDLKVLMAHWTAAYAAGGRVHGLSLRACSEIANVSLATTQVSTKRLVEAGLLRQEDSGSHTEAASWRLLLPSQLRHSPRDRDGGASECDEADNRMGPQALKTLARLMSLDAFAFRGLGASGLKIMAALSEMDRPDRAQIALAASVSIPTTYRHLPRLEMAGLVERQGEVFVLTAQARARVAEALRDKGSEWRDSWVELASQLGTEGVLERRQRLYEGHRKHWLETVLPGLLERRQADFQPVRGDEADGVVQVGGDVVELATGRIIPGAVLADDGRLMYLQDEPSPQELERMRLEALAAWESAA